MSGRHLPIGEVSRLTGVSCDLIRAWERRYGLLKPRRSTSNARLYSTEDVARLRLMRHYTRQNIPRAQAATLVDRAFTAPLPHNPGIPEADVRKALRVMHGSLESFDCEPADRVLQRLMGSSAPP